MTEKNTIDADRAKFVQYAADCWIDIKEANSTAANAKVRAGDKIVDHWVENGSVKDLLLPLLSHSSPTVRFAAAAHLIKYDAKEQAILVLRNLIKDPVGLISPSASAVLRIHQIPLDD